jgi:hypothetical protein
MIAFNRFSWRGAVALGASFALGAVALTVLGERDAHAQSCNPFKTSVTFEVPPDNLFSGNVYFNLQSNCPGHPKACGGSFALPTGATVDQKCAAMAAAVASSCSAPPNQFTVINNECTLATPSLAITDPTCSASVLPGYGMIVGISNSLGVYNQENGNPLPDYELDEVLPDCSGCAVSVCDTLVNKNLGATGQPIATGVPVGVAFYVDLTPLGGAFIEENVTTTPGLNCNNIVAQGVTALNHQLGFTSTGVTCTQTLVNGVGGRSFSCASPNGTPVASGLQTNDTGIVRSVNAGACPAIQAVTSAIDQNAGTCQSFTSCSIGSTTNPPPGALASGAAAGTVTIARPNPGTFSSLVALGTNGPVVDGYVILEATCGVAGSGLPPVSQWSYLLIFTEGTLPGSTAAAVSHYMIVAQPAAGFTDAYLGTVLPGLTTEAILNGGRAVAQPLSAPSTTYVPSNAPPQSSYVVTGTIAVGCPATPPWSLGMLGAMLLVLPVAYAARRRSANSRAA